MINVLGNKRSVGQAISPLLLVLMVSLGMLALPAWAGSIFDDNWSPPPAAPKAVEPPQQGETPDTGTPAAQQPAPASAEPRAAATVETPVPEAVAQRRSIPPKTDQSRSRKLFKDVYAKELADQSPSGRMTLAKKLIHEADKMASVPSDHFVLLLGAFEAGRDAANLGLCLEAADALADRYEVDGLKLKAEVAASLTAKANASAANAENCRNALPLLDELIAAEEYDTVTHLATALRPMASSDPPLMLLLQNRGKEAETLRSGSEALKKDLARLKGSPDDAAANLFAGRFLCFEKGEWERGLPLLARGSDAKLKELASAELAKPTETKSIEQLADRWWEIASTQHDSTRARIAQHAAALYSDASEGATGIRRLMIDKKSDQAAAAAGSFSRKVDLLALINPKRDSVDGNWKLERGELVASSIGHLSRIRIPYRPPEEYDFRIEFTRAQGNCILQMLSHQHHNFKWVLDLSGRTCGFDLINGRDCNDNEAHLDKPNSVHDGVRCTCVVQVRRGFVAAYVDGQLFEKYQVDYSQMSIEPMWDVGNDCLGIGAAENNTTFHVIELTEISGTGRRSPRLKE